MHWLFDLVFSDIPTRNGNLDSQKNLSRDLYSSFIHSCQNCYFHWSDRFIIDQIFCSYSNLNNHRLSVIHASKTCVQRIYLPFCHTEFLKNRYSSPNLITLINLCCFIMDILKINLKKKWLWQQECHDHSQHWMVPLPWSRPPALPTVTFSCHCTS